MLLLLLTAILLALVVRIALVVAPTLFASLLVLPLVALIPLLIALVAVGLSFALLPLGFPAVAALAVVRPFLRGGLCRRHDGLRSAAFHLVGLRPAGLNAGAAPTALLAVTRVEAVAHVVRAYAGLGLPCAAGHSFRGAGAILAG